MAVIYTKEQEQVINERGCNLLVSAAAGSGKTAVLVERIIQMITDEDALISIDQLLIVTFTHAAASEMAERISLAIEKKINEVKSDRLMNHLIEQLTLMSSANIMTLHSFCLSILKNYYHMIDLDPKFRIGNETELVLLSEEVLDEMLESLYEKGEAHFLDVIECYAHGKDDQGIRDLIHALHRFSRSYPWPREWMEASLEKIKFNHERDILESQYVEILSDQLKSILGQATEAFCELNDLMILEGGPTKYNDTVEALKEIFEQVSVLDQAKQYNEIGEVLVRVQVPPLSRKRKGFDVELANEAKSHIDNLRAWVKELNFLNYNKSSILEEMSLNYTRTKTLIALTNEFGQRIALAKKDKNLIDFSDIEHFALDILYDQTDTSYQFSDVAATYKESFVEVLVDEYQDINEVQESILQAVTKQMDPNNNLFMVGDLKQSIYKFRLAKPEIFRDKYGTYSYDKSDNMKIDLAKNFRSRQGVVCFTNDIFEKVMSLEIGDVNYDDKVKLYLGANYYEEKAFKESETDYTPEILIVENVNKQENRFIKQARVISNKIKKIIDEELPIYDKSLDGTGGQRPAKYKDICILLRSPSGCIGDVKDVFDMHGIPYVSDQSSGYFGAIEVQLVLNILRVIDNPYDEISLISVLRSPWIGLDENQLIEIREYLPEVSYYDALRAYSESSFDDQESLVKTITYFLETIERMRSESYVKPISDLVQLVYDITGYKYMMGYMSGGAQRVTNLEFLEMMAKQYENTSYSGLFNFLRYIKHIEKYDIDVPEPLSETGLNDAVTIMSIHKSKGLEFPIVFIMDIGKQFNMMDMKASILLHQELGIGSDYIDTVNRFKKDTFVTKAMRLKGQYEIISEELRLFYVALTRAREKLFLVHAAKDIEKTVEEIQSNYKYVNRTVDVGRIKKAKSYYDFISLCCSDFENESYKYEIIMEKDAIIEQAFGQLTAEENYKTLLDLIESPYELDEESEIYRQLMEMFAPYEHEKSIGKFVTLSVSELKRTHMEEEEILNLSIPTYEEVVPEFIDKKEQQGAYYGTLVHTVLAHLSVRKGHTYESIGNEINILVKKGILNEEDGKKISIKSLLTFTKTDLYQRMVSASMGGFLEVEKPFVMKVEEDGDLQMVQGVIDGYFYEGDSIVLYDYKTDRNVSKEQLVLRYRHQLTYYKKALESITKKSVTEVYIYSVSLNAEIVVPL